jgi:hypothetical protein
MLAALMSDPSKENHASFEKNQDKYIESVN